MIDATSGSFCGVEPVVSCVETIFLCSCVTVVKFLLAPWHELMFQAVSECVAEGMSALCVCIIAWRPHFMEIIVVQTVGSLRHKENIFLS